ncbi:MAG: gliding motility-associated C-terminal domain-containing protein, partial [Flavobacteriales bacterium]|nr:gliding motility-associated C-terminal domain-containing protein [Flavobacteriales bacterium]
DQFRIMASGVEEFEINIFNRWGSLKFSQTADKIAWDGRTLAGAICPDGVYYFVLKAKSVSGKDWSTEGHITLMR